MNEAVVLIVDDSPTVRKIVQLTLQREGNINVVAASDGLGALAAVADYQPDLILLDVMLPHMDGYSICQIIRKNPDFRNTPVIMLSGRDGIFDKMRGKLAGSTEYLTKPFDSHELAQTVQRHLANAPRRMRANTPSQQQRMRHS